MPKGWSKAPTLDGWVQIVRGPRPKSEKWPKAGQQKVHPKRNQSDASKGHPPTRQWERDSVPSSTQQQSHPRSSGRRGEFGGRTIARSHSYFGREQSVVCSVAGSPPRCTRQVQGPSSERESRGMQEFHREGQEVVRTEALLAKAHEQKLIFESEMRGRRSASLAAVGRVGGTARASGSIGRRIAKENRPVGPGARCVAGKSSEESASRCVDDGWNSTHSAGSTSHDRGPTGFGRMAELTAIFGTHWSSGIATVAEESSGGTRVCEDGGVRASSQDWCWRAHSGAAQ